MCEDKSLLVGLCDLVLKLKQTQQKMKERQEKADQTIATYLAENIKFKAELELLKYERSLIK
jgi:cell division protein FtsB